MHDAYLEFLLDEYHFIYKNHRPNYGMEGAVQPYLMRHGTMYPRVHNSLELSKSFDTEIFKRTYQYMKDTRKHFIYIIEETEGYWKMYKHHAKIHKYCRRAKISEDKIVYINQDITTKERYDLWFKNQSEYKTKINMISYPTLLHAFASNYHQRHKNTGEKYKILRYEDRNQLPTKKFMCLMGKIGWFRENLWNYFEQNEDIKNNGFISYLKKGIVLPNSWEETFTNHQGINTQEITENHILNGESSPIIDKLASYYEDSYFSIIPETNAGIRITEKTTKVLYHGHPFIMFCPSSDMTSKKVGMLEKLREWGFETFPELFDESYDDLPLREPYGSEYLHSEYYNRIMGPDIQARWKSFIKNIERLNRMDSSELHKLCDSVYEKCVHNQKTLLNLKKPGEQLLSELKIIVEKLK